MPSVTLQPASGSGAPSLPGVRVFVSYSHEDARLARKFVQYFELLAQSLRLDARQALFFDERRLLAGYVWQDTLLQSIDEADLLVFLVSANSLRADHYCMRMEVARAAAAGIPIIPVLLTKCPWEDQAIPGHPRGLTLGALGALPRHPRQNNIKPVTHWERPDEAWDAVITGVRERLESTSPAAAGGAPPPPPAADADAGVVDTELIPYLCDQRSAVRRFDAGLEAWDARALVVLVKGVYDDNPAQFWKRLRLENLAEFLDVDAQRGAGPGHDRPLPLPADDDAGSGADLRRMLLYELSDALTGNRYRVKDVATLTAAMQGMDGVIALLAMPAARSAPALRATLEALLALLDEIPDQEVRRRTLVAVTLEDAALAERRLADEWNLHRFPGSLVVELDPLCAVTSQDARIWHVQHRIRDRFRLDEQRITGLFQPDDALRLRRFESAFHRLLGHRGG